MESFELDKLEVECDEMVVKGDVKFRSNVLKYKDERPSVRMEGELSSLIWPYTYGGDSEASNFMNKARDRVVELLQPLPSDIQSYKNDGYYVHFSTQDIDLHYIPPNSYVKESCTFVFDEVVLLYYDKYQTYAYI